MTATTEFCYICRRHFFNLLPALASLTLAAAAAAADDDDDDDDDDAMNDDALVVTARCRVLGCKRCDAIWLQITCTRTVESLLSTHHGKTDHGEHTYSSTTLIYKRHATFRLTRNDHCCMLARAADWILTGMCPATHPAAGCGLLGAAVSLLNIASICQRHSTDARAATVCNACRQLSVAASSAALACICQLLHSSGRPNVNVNNVNVNVNVNQIFI